MNPYPLDGLTPAQPALSQPIALSKKDRSIRYLGRQIRQLALGDGLSEVPARKRSPNSTEDSLQPSEIAKKMPATEVLPVKHEQLLSGQTFNTAGGKQLSERLVNLQPDLATQSDSRAEVIQMTARNLVEQFQFEAIEKSPTKEVLCAVFLECLITHCVPYSTIGKKLAETNALSGAEKVRVLLASEEKLKHLHSARIWSRIPLSIRLEEAKNLFQRLPDLPEMDNEISVQLTTFNRDNLVKVSLLEIRQTLNSENNELSTQLLSDVDHIEKKFIPRVKGNGHFLDNNAYRDFIIYTRKLLYLYAACSGYSQKADIAELVSYIRAVLYTIHTDNLCPDNIWHIAKELAYLSKQPGSIDYCRYIAAVANILKAPAPVALQFEELKQLSDIRGFAFLESQPLGKYLTALRTNIENITPEYSRVLLRAVDQLESKVVAIPLPEGKPGIKAKVHRLLMVIAACKSPGQIMDPLLLGHFVSNIMEHGNKKNIPYLISGLARLVQSTRKIQQILGDTPSSGKKHLRLAPLPLLAFVPDTISEDDVEELCQSLHNSPASKRCIKDGKVFHQWLATLEQVLASELMNKAMVMPMLKKLTQSLTYEKLVWLYLAFTMGDNFNKVLRSLGFSCQEEGLPLLIAEKGVDALVGVNKAVTQWLLKQRHYQLLPFYMAAMSEEGNSDVTDLIHEFIQSSANHTFIENRQSPLNNPHLQAVYRKYRQFKAGWGANFSGFSEETRNKLLSPGETLELTENSWDLFISGLELNTCLAPNGIQEFRSGLMSYVMDGRNAMIVKKNQKGTILGRSVIRMVLDQDDRPALFLEKGYPDERNLMFIDAARDIADEMELALYHWGDGKKGEKGKTVKLLIGRAPFDYFDAFSFLKEREEVTLTNVQRDVNQPSYDRH